MYYTTIYKTQAYAIQFVTGCNFYKFTDDNKKIIYSFKLDENSETTLEFLKKVDILNQLKNNKIK